MTDYSDLAMPDHAADFTLTLGNVIALGYDTDEKLHLDPKHYPIFDEKHRPELNHKIAAHYALREIGQETVEQFVFYLGRTMNEIMPYYNQLYASEQKKYDPLLTTDMTSKIDSNNVTESSGKSNGDQSSKVTGSSDTKSTSDTDATSFHSENPQTQSDFTNNATTADRTQSHAETNTQNSQSSDTESVSHSATDFSHSNDVGNTLQHSAGFSGVSGAQLITEWRSAMLNIDMMIINELETCFMGIWGTADQMRRDYMPLYHIEDRI